MKSPTSHIYFSQRLRLHYVDWGGQAPAAENAPAATNMVLVHGIQDHCRTWDDLAAEFYQQYHVVAPDLRGHGDSEWVKGAAYHYMDYLYDLNQLVTQADLAPITLVGHSMGGAIAALFAGVFPELVGRLVIIEGIGLWQKFNPLPDVQTAMREWVGATRQLSARLPRRYPQLSDAYQRMQQANPQLSESQALHLTIHGSNQHEDGTYSWHYDNYTYNFASNSIGEADICALWEAIQCPTLIINADEGLEHRIGQDDTLKYFNDAQLVELPSTGHWTYHDDLPGLVQVMKKFLEDAG